MGLGGLGNPIVLVILVLPLVLIIAGVLRRPRGGPQRSVGPIQALTLLINNLFNFQGRSSRGAYWWGYFWVGVFQSLVGGVFSVLAPVLAPLVSLVSVLMLLAVGVRRLHDVGLSGWHALWNLTIIGGIVLLFFLATAGKGEENRFGLDQEAGIDQNR
jgi:uncharacterized membrane protein YhaH (DUF805 family)